MKNELKIDLNLIRDNIKTYKIELGEKKFCAVVKADSYGLGAKKICEAIDDIVDYFAVSSRREFFEVKRHVSKPILLLTPIYKNITILAMRGCEFCVSNIFELKTIERFAKRNKNIFYKIHLAFNTGMNRFGFSKFKEIDELLDIVQKTQNIVICGIFSHFCVGNNKIIAENQIKIFENFKKYLMTKINVEGLIFHISNTAGFENCKKFDMVRIGLGMFLKHNKQSFLLTAKIIEFQKIKSGETVGYGLGFLAQKNMKVAIVSIGYADGIFRKIDTNGYVLTNGKFSKILAVCMDSMIVDVTDINCSYLDDVVLIGKSGENQIFVCDVARWCDTIEYEIMTSLSKRIKRVYIGGNINANNHRKI